MGEKKRRQGAAERFLRQHPTCALCGGETPATTREHFPPTSLFRDYYRPNSFVVPACRDCNIGSSTSDLLASLLSRITLGELRGSENEEFRRLASQLGRQDALTANELLDVGLVEKKKKIRSFREAAGLPWQPLEAFRMGPRAWAWLNVFAHKAAASMFYERRKKIVTPADGVLCLYRFKEQVITGDLPHELMQALGPMTTIRQGSRSFEDQFELADAYNADDKLYGFMCRFRFGFLLFGFVIEAIDRHGERYEGYAFRPPFSFDKFLSQELGEQGAMAGREKAAKPRLYRTEAESAKVGGKNISVTTVRFDEATMWLELSDGRTLEVPLPWFPRLLDACPADREKVEIGHFGLHWEHLDEDISIAGLLAGRGDMTRRVEALGR